MAKVKTNVAVVAEIAAVMSESEAEAMMVLAAYNTDDIIEALYAQFGSGALAQHEGVIRGFFHSLRSQLPAQMARIAEARAALKGKP